MLQTSRYETMWSSILQTLTCRMKGSLLCPRRERWSCPCFSLGFSIRKSIPIKWDYISIIMNYYGYYRTSDIYIIADSRWRYHAIDSVVQQFRAARFIVASSFFHGVTHLVLFRSGLAQIRLSILVVKSEWSVRRNMSGFEDFCINTTWLASSRKRIPALESSVAMKRVAILIDWTWIKSLP